GLLSLHRLELASDPLQLLGERLVVDQASVVRVQHLAPALPEVRDPEPSPALASPAHAGARKVTTDGPLESEVLTKQPKPEQRGPRQPLARPRRLSAALAAMPTTEQGKA